ncbi:hypothetical protein EV421DRAFT_1975333 [Armillaria borealis]|uniref:Uncharacterized protein n=1 Tax=Armillaria borealis TaxID=47425 RepID=A0AA39J715_9AGAR|nr:hypothetical protein EV421DRAFT_1975333 [Armillaria borealis]
MSYYFILGTEETTNGIGGYVATSPFHATYPYVAFDASIAQRVEDTYPQESHEATASSQSESDVSSASAESQSNQSLNDQMAGTVNAPNSLPAQEILSDPESVEERLPPEYPFLFTTHSIRLNPLTNEPYSSGVIEAPIGQVIRSQDMFSDRKQISEALGQVKYKFRTPGLSPYNRHLIWFKDPAVPSDTPGVSMSQILKGDRGCVDMSDSVPHELPGNSCYIDVVFRAPGYQPQYIRIPIDCRHAKLKRQKIRPTYYNLAYAISEGYKEILQREEPNTFPERSWDGKLLPVVTNVCYLRLLRLYTIDDEKTIWGAEVVLMDSLF